MNTANTFETPFDTHHLKIYFYKYKTNSYSMDVFYWVALKIYL